MVRKANTLKSLKELEMPAKVRYYVKMKRESLDEVVLYGRIYDYKRDDYQKVKLKWIPMYVRALDKAGFIRHDIQRMLNLGKFYADVFDLPEIKAEAESMLESNEAYEKYYISDEDYEQLLRVLDVALSKRGSLTLKHRYGLIDGEPKTLRAIGQEIGITHGYVRQIEGKALHDLRDFCRTYQLPIVFDAQKDERKISQ